MHILQCSQPATVITDWTEENQEGTLCGPDKQAACLRKQCTHVDFSPRLCPSPGPRTPQCYLSSLKSGCVFGQPCQNKRRSVTSKVESLAECSKCQSTSEEKTVHLHKQEQAREAPGLLSAASSGPRGVLTTWLLWRMIYLDTLNTELLLPCY